MVMHEKYMMLLDGVWCVWIFENGRGERTMNLGKTIFDLIFGRWMFCSKVQGRKGEDGRLYLLL